MSSMVADMLAEARRRFTEAGIVDPAADARLLVAGLLKLSPTELLTRSAERLSAEQAEVIFKALERRLGHAGAFCVAKWRGHARFDVGNRCCKLSRVPATVVNVCPSGPRGLSSRDTAASESPMGV